MAGTAKAYDVTQLHQGPGDVWFIPFAVAPTDTAMRLTLATDGTPDATAHAGSICAGLTDGGITTDLKDKITETMVDQADGPVDVFKETVAASIGFTMSQAGLTLLQNAYSTGVFSTQASPGWNQVTFGGINTVPVVCIAAISPKRTGSGLFIVTVLYKAYSKGGMQRLMQRKAESKNKVDFVGLTDLTRTAGKQIGIHYETT